MEQYSGLDQAANNLDRCALLYGPVLMACVGQLRGPGCIPRFNASPEELPALLRSTGGRPLDRAVEGFPDYTYKPYWEVTNEMFTCFPIVEP